MRYAAIDTNPEENVRLLVSEARLHLWKLSVCSSAVTQCMAHLVASVSVRMFMRRDSEQLHETTALKASRALI